MATKSQLMNEARLLGIAGRSQMTADELQSAIAAVRQGVAGMTTFNAGGGRVAHPLAARCKWFAMCDNAATGTLSAGPLGDVPICDRCRARATS